MIKPALLFGLVLFSLHAHAVSSISIRVGHLQSAAGELRDLKLDYSLASNKLGLSSRYKQAGDADWQPAQLDCARLLIAAAGHLQCEQGRLKGWVAGQLGIGPQKESRHVEARLVKELQGTWGTCRLNSTATLATSFEGLVLCSFCLLQSH